MSDQHLQFLIWLSRQISYRYTHLTVYKLNHNIRLADCIIYVSYCSDCIIRFLLFHIIVITKYIKSQAMRDCEHYVQVIQYLVIVYEKKYLEAKPRCILFHILMTRYCIINLAHTFFVECHDYQLLLIQDSLSQIRLNEYQLKNISFNYNIHVCGI